MSPSNNVVGTLVIIGQYRENYGAHDWNGKGICPSYWKNKGGHTVAIASAVPSDDWMGLAVEMEDRMIGFNWCDTGSSCDFGEIDIRPDNLSMEDACAWEYGNYEYITSMTIEQVENFKVASTKFRKDLKAFYNQRSMEQAVNAGDYA